MQALWPPLPLPSPHHNRIDRLSEMAIIAVGILSICPWLAVTNINRNGDRQSKSALSINVAKQTQIEEKEHPYECHVVISTTTNDDHHHLDYISTRNQARVELNLGHTFAINFIAL